MTFLSVPCGPLAVAARWDPCPAGIFALLPSPAPACLSSLPPYADCVFFSAPDYFQGELQGMLRVAHVFQQVCALLDTHTHPVQSI